MTLEEIKKAVLDGKVVHWSNDGYFVKYDEKLKDFYIIFEPNNHCIGLTWADGKTMNGKESEFYIEIDHV